MEQIWGLGDPRQAGLLETVGRVPMLTSLFPLDVLSVSKQAFVY